MRPCVLSGPLTSAQRLFVRKLEYILADAVASGADTIVTLGGIQSNHCRATVAAANALGLEAHVVLRTSRLVVEEDPGVAGNLLVSRLSNAHIHLVTKEEYQKYGQAELGRRVVEELKSHGKRPYLIVVGGSSALGTYGYINMVEELAQQQDGARPPDKVVVACGSGGTVAGIALGLDAHPLFHDTTTLDAVMVCDNASYFTEYIVDLYKELGLDDVRARGVLERTTTFVQGKGAGYSISREEELDTLIDIAGESSIALDPTYTGKAMHYWLQHVRNNPEQYRGKKVLFVHTGGLSSVHGCDAVERRLEVRGRSGGKGGNGGGAQYRRLLL
jgi:D-cysteine desulfhydrase